MASNVVELGDFGKMNFGAAVLGDGRRTDRLVLLANQIVAHPAGSLPQKLGDPAAYQAMYRLCKCPEVTHAAVLEPHRQLTLEKMRNCEQAVLNLQDTTELDYTSRTKLHDQLGQIGDGDGRGYECHNSLAVVAETGEVLGLANQILHHCADVPKNESVAAKREREDRESRLWLWGSQALGEAPPDRLWVDVCDRGADTFEFHDDEHRRRRSYLVRSLHSRAVLLGHGSEEGSEAQRGLLHDVMRAQEAIGGRMVYIPAGPGRKARWAKCLISVAEVRLCPPHVKRGEHGNEPLCVWGVRVWEIDAPPDVAEPLEWLLLSNVPTTNLAEAVERLMWYERRWIIEDYHKAKKTGCGIEKLQFDFVDRLEPMIALLSVTALTLLKLRDAARHKDADAVPASDYVPEVYVAVLSVWRYKQRRVDLTGREFFMALARLGGHQNRKRDGTPGWITLWRGWNKLQQMVDYATKAGTEKM